MFFLFDSGLLFWATLYVCTVTTALPKCAAALQTTATSQNCAPLSKHIRRLSTDGTAGIVPGLFALFNSTLKQ